MSLLKYLRYDEVPGEVPEVSFFCVHCGVPRVFIPEVESVMNFKNV